VRLYYRIGRKEKNLAPIKKIKDRHIDDNESIKKMNDTKTFTANYNDKWKW